MFSLTIAWMLAFAVVTKLVGVMPWWLPAMVLSTALAANLELFGLFQRRNGLLFALGGYFSINSTISIARQLTAGVGSL